MRLLPLGLLLLLSSGQLYAQQGLDADDFPAAPAAQDYFSVRRAGKRGCGLALSLASSWHMLADGLGPGTGWQVRERLRLQLGFGIELADDWRLSGWTAYLFRQQGERIASDADREVIPAGWGESWLAVEHTAWREEGAVLGLLLGLRLPGARAASLGGDPDWGLQLGVLARFDLEWLEMAADAGLVTRSQVHYRQLLWDDAWHLALALAGGPAAWPLRPLLELRGSGLWAVPAGTGPAHWWQASAGVRLKLGPLVVVLGAGHGLYGLPVARWRLLVRLGLAHQKNGRPEE